MSHEGAGNVEAPDISQNKGADGGSKIKHPEVAAYYHYYASVCTLLGIIVDSPRVFDDNRGHAVPWMHIYIDERRSRT